MSSLIASPSSREPSFWVNAGQHPVTMYRMVSPPQRATATTPAVAAVYERTPSRDISVSQREGVLLLGSARGDASEEVDMDEAPLIAPDGSVMPAEDAPEFDRLVIKGRAPGAEPVDVRDLETFVGALTGHSLQEHHGTHHDFVVVTNALVAAWMEKRQHTDPFIKELLDTMLFVGPNTDGLYGVRNEAGSIVGTTQLIKFNAKQLRRARAQRARGAGAEL